MSILDDETLQMYVEESADHLQDIEQDLLTIEAGGADIDSELVNKVFRAAHSIKGGAGFLGLTKINELAHKLENVLGMIRSCEIVPNPDIINTLLEGFDKLQSLVQDVEASNDADIDAHTVALAGLTTAMLPQEKKSTVAREVGLQLPDGRAHFDTTEFEVAAAVKGGKHLYILEFDLVRDVERRGTTPLELISELDDGGVLIDCRVDLAAVGTLEDTPPDNVLPFFVLYATIMGPEIIDSILEIPAEQVHLLPPPAGSTGELSAAPAAEEPTAPVATLEAQVAESPPKPVKPASKGPPAARKPDTSLRVHVGLLDNLMTLAGELVLGRNQLLQALGSDDRRSLEVVTQRLDLITSELQEAIMLTRMQPVGNIFNKFTRLVRDLTRKLSKQIQLNLEGTEVELDKTIIEGLSDPLTHLVRNSVDHGIEPPEVRVAAGKDAQGSVVLRAYHEAGHVNIEISDDGKGLDGDKLAESAVDKGLLTSEQVRGMSDAEKVRLIFLPGFSTADKVTDVSGRGVGMDVVRTNLDKLGGVVDIESEVGSGTTIRIKLPLTLAIIPSQIVVTGTQRFAIPQVNMDELLRIPAAQVQHRLERVGDAVVVRLRDQLLPLVPLADVLGLPRTYLDPADGAQRADRRQEVADRRCPQRPAPEPDVCSVSAASDLPPVEDLAEAGPGGAEAPRWISQRSDEDRRDSAESAVNIVVASTGALRYGLVVDELHDAEEIVVKPLGRHLKQCLGFAGATIMGNGQVALILDVAGLARQAGLSIIAGPERSVREAKELAELDARYAESMLLFHNAPGEQFAMPLDVVLRIVRIRASAIERVAGRRVMQYKGGTLPLYAIEDVASVQPRSESQELMVLIVAGHRGGESGILASGPVDSHLGDLEVDRTSLVQPGIAGSMIVDGKTTLVLDVEQVTSTHAALNGPVPGPAGWPEGTGPRVLLAEDSTFFRNQVGEFLSDLGCRVLQAEDGLAAWQTLEQLGADIDLVLTDIEMPNLDGLGLTRRIRGDGRFASLPVVALTTLADDEDRQRGLSAGVDEYQVKLDRDGLIDSIRRLVAGPVCAGSGGDPG